MKLYSSKLAPSPLKVLIFLKEKAIFDQVEIIDLDLGKLEHKTPEYKTIAPNSKVPALKLDDNTIILETTAICRYLESLYPEPNLFGENPIEIASIEMWYSRVTYELMVPLMHGFRHTHPHMRTTKGVWAVGATFHAHVHAYIHTCAHPHTYTLKRASVRIRTLAQAHHTASSLKALGASA